MLKMNFIKLLMQKKTSRNKSMYTKTYKRLIRYLTFNYFRWKKAHNALKQNRNLWTNLVNLLKDRKLLPVINFTFSKKRCDEFAAALTNLDLCDRVEKSKIHSFIEKSLTRLSGKISNKNCEKLWFRSLN